MMIVKMLLVFIAAWIATFWSTAWTSVLMTLALAVLCLQIAYGRQARPTASA